MKTYAQNLDADSSSQCDKIVDLNLRVILLGNPRPHHDPPVGTHWLRPVINISYRKWHKIMKWIKTECVKISKFLLKNGAALHRQVQAGFHPHWPHELDLHRGEVGVHLQNKGLHGRDIRGLSFVPCWELLKLKSADQELVLMPNKK